MRSKVLNVSVSAIVAGSLWIGSLATVRAAEPEQHASVVVRASGKSGTVTRNKRAGVAEAETMPSQIEGGVIPRAALQAELGRGIGRFLQQVRTQPVVSRGRFMGWKITTLFPNRADVKVAGIQVGDIVLRANGQSIERPEEFMSLWNLLATAEQLVLDIQRNGETTTVRYAIK